VVTFTVSHRDAKLEFPSLIGVGQVCQGSQGYPLLAGVVEILYEDVAL